MKTDQREGVERHSARTEAGPAYSPRADAAWTIAALVHHQQRRKGTDIPYIIHPAQVALILQRYGWPEDVVIAGLLHDVLEDAKCDEPELRNRLRAAFPALRSAPSDATGFRQALRGAIEAIFGGTVLHLVDGVSERKTDQRGRRPWRERKEEQLEALSNGDRAMAAVKAADMLHNARSIARDVRESGPGIMERFNADTEETLWYYHKSREVIGERLGAGDPLSAELTDAVRDLEAALATPPSS